MLIYYVYNKILLGFLRAEFWRHGVLSGGTQRRALSRYQSDEMIIIIFNFYERESNPKPIASAVTSPGHNCPQFLKNVDIKNGQRQSGTLTDNSQHSNIKYRYGP